MGKNAQDRSICEKKKEGDRANGEQLPATPALRQQKKKIAFSVSTKRNQQGTATLWWKKEKKKKGQT